jgi:hypothetical protein
MVLGDWIGLGALALTLLALIITHFRAPALVPSPNFADLRAIVAELQPAIDSCRQDNMRMAERISRLESQLDILRNPDGFWQEKIRKLQGEGSA